MKSNLTRLQYEIRKDIIESTTHANSGHAISALSIVEILLVLYYKILNHKKAKYSKYPYDTLILSKGHAVPALYSILSRLGYFDRELLNSLREFNSPLTGHPFRNEDIGVDVTTGSLGQGLSVGCGIALADKLNKFNNHVFVILGDGECQEGQIWESALFASHHGLNNLMVIIDRNKLQSNGSTEDILSLDKFDFDYTSSLLSDKWESFGWNVLEAKGHDIDDLFNKITDGMLSKKPFILIAHTIKGNGIKSMENNLEFHSRPLKDYEIDDAQKELYERYKIYLQI